MDVKVYSTKTCSYCVMAKQYLSAKGIDYQDIDVSTDKTAADEMVKISGQMGVPVIVAGGEIIVGFDKARLEAILNI